MANYRKSLIVAMTSCCYLDERPVNEIERNLAEAFMRGGKDEEIRVRDDYAEKQRQGMKNNIEYLKQAQQDGKVKRKEAFKIMMEKVKKEKVELIERKQKLEDEICVMEEFNLMRPYKLNEIAKIDTEMKAITFKELLEKDEDCPEGLKPYGADGKSYMRKFLEDKESGEIFNSRVRKENEAQRAPRIIVADPDFRVQRVERQQNAEREAGVNGVKAGGIIPAVKPQERSRSNDSNGSQGSGGAVSGTDSESEMDFKGK